MNVHHDSTARGDGGRLGRKREVRLEAILDAAAAIVAEEGLEALTLQRVATATGYVPAALYRYVGSKDGLLAALQRRAVEDAHRAFVAAQAASARRAGAADAGALAALHETARFYLDLPRSRPQTWLLVALLLGDPRPLLSDDEARRTAPALSAFLGDVRALFERAVSAGALGEGDAHHRTLAFWAALHGALTLEKMRRVAPALPTSAEIGMASAHALLLGWGADAETLRRVAAGVDADPAAAAERRSASRSTSPRAAARSTKQGARRGAAKGRT